MTAGPKQRPAKRAKWVDYLAVTYQELTRAFWHRSIFEDLRKEIGTRNPAADGNFVVSYQRLYAESMMMMVRRLADHDKRNVSLWNIWDAIARDPQCVSRAEYVEHFADSRGRESADAYFSSHFGLGDHVDPDVMESYKTTLDADVAKLTDFVNANVAHRSAVSKVASMGNSDIHTALDDVVTNDNSLRSLLLQPFAMYDMISVPPSWRTSLRGLFPPIEPPAL